MIFRKKGKADEVYRRLTDGLSPHWKKVDADLIDPLVAAMSSSMLEGGVSDRSIARHLVLEVRAAAGGIEAFEAAHQAFNERHTVMRSEAERRGNILAYAAELGATEKELKGDRKAFLRHFGHDAMVARFQSRLGDRQRRLAFLLERTGTLARRTLRDAEDPVSEWRALGIETLTRPLLEFEGDPRVATSAFRCLAGALLGLAPETRKSLIGAGTTQTIFRLAQDRERDVWIQSEAIAFLHEISHESFGSLVHLRLNDPPRGDDFFVRRRLVPLALDWDPGFAEKICRDYSPFVRQGLAGELSGLTAEGMLPVLRTLAVGDSEPSVRAAAILEIPGVTRSGDAPFPELAELLRMILSTEKNEYVSRVAMLIVSRAHGMMPESRREAWRAALLPELRSIHRRGETARLRRWAAQARERIWCDADPVRRDLRDRIGAATRGVKPGRSLRFSDPALGGLDDLTVGRILSVLAQDDFGFDVTRSGNSLKIIRGHRFGFRLWRFLHELRSPSPEKREGFSHTIGRIFQGHIRVPSAVLSEMSETKVPGEPLTLSREDGWRPFLPLVDEVISALDENSRRRPLQIVTSEGVTRLWPPRSPVGRMRAHHSLNRKFGELARMRNSESPSDYIGALRGLGFSCEFSPAGDESVDPDVAGTFSRHSFPFLALLAAPTGWERIRDYFYSAYENTIGQLLIFLGGAFAWFAGRHIYLNQRFYRLRNRIPLVIGGWGTRGKSGTERIKAAMFNALGHRIVSKTTGCEAMFLYAPSFGKLQELFLFRPYDKATIWEQVNIVNLAARLRSHVFLYECMALTPAYVEIIQRQWMRDDISTLVNAYPDHEDLQGPAGINIPEVMTFFLRKGGHCLTSEQQMTPILEAGARRIGCRLDRVGWIEPGLLTPDVLERFPYEEHPNNIALVAELGEQLDIPRDFALKEMADRVVPDLGVLKVYPVATLSGRRLQFVNGCSANERFGALGNWRRLGFDRQDPIDEPGVWITAVVNNRADRVARSRVFASLVAKDIAVDRLFLIGTNLRGLVGYMHEAFRSWATEWTLFPGDGELPEEILAKAAHRMRLPASREELARMVEAVRGEEELAPWREPYETAYAEYEAFREKLDGGGDREELDREFRDLFEGWFGRKLVVIWDSHATGDQVIHRITRETPPGYLNRIMGLQNIKGTGLDFVYRWQSWDTCYESCRQMMDRKFKIAREGLARLAAFKEFGPLCEERVEAAIAMADERHGTRDKGFRTQLQIVRKNMSNRLAEIEPTLRDRPADGDRCGRFGEAVLRMTESILDAGDAIRRRRGADQIYRDLAAERISPANATIEIAKLNKRQKGGWLKRDREARRRPEVRARR